MTRDPISTRLEKAGRRLQNMRETSYAEDCYQAAELLRKCERQIVKLLAYVQSLEKRREA